MSEFKKFRLGNKKLLICSILVSFLLLFACLKVYYDLFRGLNESLYFFDEAEIQQNIEEKAIKPKGLVETPALAQVKEETLKEPELISLGNFRLTAYCSCPKCCGYWATVRPVDENGKEIVYGSSGEVLTAGVSVAVDTSVIPYGSELLINGTKYIAHDTGSGINGNCIDVYHDDHQKAVEFGLQYAEVFLVEE